jgi:hypothetical protein
LDEVCICLLSCIRLPSTNALGLPCEASASAGDSFCPYLPAATGAADGPGE